MTREEGLDDKKARALILARMVWINGKPVTSTGEKVSPDDSVRIQESRNYPSRAAGKLLGAFDAFPFNVSDRICVDLGASHGGFVSVLLERGARKVLAVDVAYGILDYSVRQNPRVVVLERTNAKEIRSSWFSEDDLKTDDPIIFTSDLSFISLRGVLEKIVLFLRERNLKAEGVFLIKPQFESSKDTENGILVDPGIREKIVRGMEEFSRSIGFTVAGRTESPVKGSGGNQESLLYLKFFPENG